MVNIQDRETRWGNGEVIPEEDGEGLNKSSGGTDVQGGILVDFRNIQYIGIGCCIDSEKEKDFYLKSPEHLDQVSG